MLKKVTHSPFQPNIPTPVEEMEKMGNARMKPNKELMELVDLLMLMKAIVMIYMILSPNNQSLLLLMLDPGHSTVEVS
jgi:hypothetical protein